MEQGNRRSFEYLPPNAEQRLPALSRPFEDQGWLRRAMRTCGLAHTSQLQCGGAKLGYRSWGAEMVSRAAPQVTPKHALAMCLSSLLLDSRSEADALVLDVRRHVWV